VNQAKYDVTTVGEESDKALQFHRRKKQTFFDEKRAVFLLITTKTSRQKILLASFHAKKRCSDIKREETILDFFRLLEDIGQSIGANIHILVGTDINHRMHKFQMRNKNKSFCVQVFNYEYPDKCKRKERDVIDFFLHSRHLVPANSIPEIFHEDLDILDHHPIFTHFICNYKPVSKQLTEIVTGPPEKQPTSEPDKSRSLQNNLADSGDKNDYISEDPVKNVTNKPKVSQEDKPWILPSRNQSPTIGPPQTQTLHSGDGNQSVSYTESVGAGIHSLLGAGYQEGIRGAARYQPDFSRDTTLGFLGTSTQSLLSPVQSLKPPANVLSRTNTRNFSSSNAASLMSKISFQCELCHDKTFSSRNGLFIHFGKANNHHPCKHKFEGEMDDNKKICLRVFSTEKGLNMHKTKQEKNPRHHQHGKPFPNLKYT